MIKNLLILVTLSVLCVAQEYEDYQPAVRHSSGSSRFSSQQQEQPKQEPVAILKQINRHNEDGSYTYGYEGADGSFKIETKAANGDVKGKYGYTDGDGKVRVVEYGADKYGFQPSGEGITVAPINYNDVKDADYEDEQQQFVARQKQVSKAPRPQSFNYAPAISEKRKLAPAPAPSAVPQYYEYEEQATPRPVQVVRPKYALPVPARPQQFINDESYSFSPQQPAPKPVERFQQIDNRRPAQFPSQTEAIAPQIANRAQQQFSLFSPASRSDSFTSKFEQFVQEPAFQYNAPQPQSPPQPAPQPQQVPQPSFQTFQRTTFASKPAQARVTSVLDQLAKDPNYILPQSSPALHDISFGYSL
ncbi:CLUMA_CG001819, isoform A [Clunio marinus]|uniref:CLUMA_CG001819, isoform A n=1 Tax=Clunio marinus TaxID=568069 RepID=A0A1J1HP95_9DIPT|nr:CLUMA_CG001819, isoform A [Clunio marinus]